MLEKDVVLSKIAIIQRCLKRIDDIVAGDASKVDQLDVQEIASLNLQRAIQASIDMANVVISLKSLGLPASYKQSFWLLEQENIISSDLSNRMKGMVGFRNIAVHDYSELDMNILKSILKDHLGDFEKFYEIVYKLFLD